jgi:hypothetical protein
MIHAYKLERRHAREMRRSNQFALAYVARDIAGEIMREMRGMR